MSKSEYRKELKKVSDEVPHTAWTVLKWGFLVVVVLALLTFLAQTLGIISINIQREVIQHSQQYVETKVNLLNKIHSDWLQLDAEIAELRASDEDNSEIIAAKIAQQRNIVKRMRTEASMIPNSQIPASVRSFLSTQNY